MDIKNRNRHFEKAFSDGERVHQVLRIKGIDFSFLQMIITAQSQLHPGFDL